ncbi:MAG: efflux RND transporter permease subunit [Desulfobacteraceae bacterium]|jgi:predicted RND superfamily exporter protein
MRTLKNTLVDFAIHHYKLATLIMVIFTFVMCAFFPLVNVDTDPENMLPANDPERVFHNKMKKQFALSETIVVGIVNKTDKDGVFNPDTLKRVYKLTEFARTLRWQDEGNPDKFSGVVEVDMLGPSLIDHMTQGAPGEIKFDWLMSTPPETREEALMIREKAYSNPMLKGRMFSEDGKVICIYLPLTDKHLSYRINTELNKVIGQMDGDEEYHIAGVPVAEVAIGVEMFSQMSVGSPLAMAVILGLLLLFFRKWRLVILPMIIAMFSVMSTMGMMIALGFDVHILSSMIPIFLMCIGTVSSIHILSEFFDSYTKDKGRKETIKEVMNTLFIPILYTSLTTAAGFASLIFTPIPPAQVFGAFLCIGVMIVWLYTIIFVPAYIMMIPEGKLENFGMSAHQKKDKNILSKILKNTGNLTYNRGKLVLVILVAVIAVGVWGTTQIKVNDNYAKRFADSHPIRKADIALNDHLDGTYTAYLILEGNKPDQFTKEQIQKVYNGLIDYADNIKAEFMDAPRLALGISQKLPELAGQNRSYEDFLASVIGYIDEKSDLSTDDEFYAYDELKGFIGLEKEKLKIFKRPEILKYIESMQNSIKKSGVVGKSTSLVDAVSKVNQEMIDGRPENYRIPDTLQGVAECYFQYQQGHRPHDLWHMVTPDYMSTNIWVQINSGDSSAIQKTVRTVDEYINQNPPPVEMTHRWAGLHYINLVLSEKLIPAMLRSFLGSFIVVFIMMSFLFRSIRWGLLCMLPLIITVLTIYGIIGIFGKDYDLPVAVLGVLALGMAVDFAIHFLQRARGKYDQKGSWKEVNTEMFGEPARAISRNVLVIAIGFLPLLVATLVPYKVMGIMLFAIMTLSGILTLLALPAMLTVAQNYFFKTKGAKVK